MSNLAYGTFTITNLSTVTSVDVYYYNSTSSSSLSGGSWSTDTPTWTNGKYIWSKTVTTWEQGVTTQSEPVCITGQKGSTGATGQSVTEITQQYALGSNSTTAPTTGWSTTMPTFESGKFYWTRSKIVWANPASTTYTTAVLANGITSANTTAAVANTNAQSAVTTANTANQTANTANQTANAANQTAQNAVSVANGKNTIYYSSSKPTGGTYKPGDTWFFLTDDGYRIYEYDTTSSDWVQKSMDGKSITAGTITAAQIQAGAITTNKLATDAIKSTNYQAGTAPYSNAGTFLDLSNGNIYSPNFGINNTNDNITDGAYIKGSIYAYNGTIGQSNTNYWYIGNYRGYDQQPSAYIKGNGTATIQLGSSGTWRLNTNRIHTAWNDDSNSGNAYRLHYPVFEDKYWDMGVHVPTSKTDKFLYIRSSDPNNAAISNSNTLENLSNDINDAIGDYWNYQFYVTSEGNLYAKNLYILDDNGGITQIAGTSAPYLLKSGGDISGNLTIGGTLKVSSNILNSSGNNITLQTSLTSTAAATLTGNSTSPISIGVTGTLPTSNGGTGNTSYNAGGVVYADGSSPKKLLSTAAGTSGYLLKSGGAGAPSWVDPGTLTVAAATKATQDGDGNVIKTTYLKLTGGNITGPVSFGDSVSIDDLNAGTLIVTGNSSFTNNAQFNTINGVEVGANPAFTDTTYTFDNGYNASSNKGATVLTVTNAINALNVNPINGATNKTLTSISETEGKISATYSNINITKSQVSDFPTSMPASDVSAWAKASTKPSYHFNEIQPLLTKTYTGVIATANDQNNGALYFMKIQPQNYGKTWSIRYKVTATIEGVSIADGSGYESSQVYLNGMRDTYSSYRAWNDITNTSYRPYYYHCFYRAKEAGITNGYGHALGIHLRYSYNPTTVANSRTVTFEILEVEGCTVTFLDAPLTYLNWPGTGSTNYNTYNNFDAVTPGMTESGDRNDPNYYNKTYYSSRTTSAALYRYQFCLTKSDGTLVPINSVNNNIATNKTLTIDSFDPFGEIFYWNSTSTYTANANMGDGALYRQYLADLRYSFNCGGYDTTPTLTARMPLYLVATPQEDGTAKLYIEPLSMYLPSSEDGLIYIYLGRVYPDTKPYRVVLSLNHPVYEYRNGAVRLYTGLKSETAVSGGTDVSLVTTGQKYLWNSKTNNTGTVTSVAASGSGGITISGSPITTSGTLAIGLNLSTAINGLGEGASPATRGDYIVAQYAGGGTTTTTYHRRKLSNIFAALNADDIPNLAWSKITSGNDDLKAIENLTGTTGLLKKTAANTWTLDTSAYLTEITSSQITTALGYTPYNSTNPNGYTTNVGTVTQITAGTGLKIGSASSGGNITTSGTINHINSVTAQPTQALYPIKIDGQGHISAYGTAVTSLPASDVSAWAKAANKPSYTYSEISGTPSSLKNPNALQIKVYNGSSTSSDISYDGSTANQSVSVAGASAITGITSTTDGKLQLTLADGTQPAAISVKITATTSDSAASADKLSLSTDVGSLIQPVYFDANTGLPVAISYTIEKSVPSNAIFTDTTYTFDGTYNASSNKAATVSTVTGAINALDGNLNNTTPGAGKTLTAFSQINGVVSATFGNISITKSQISDFPSTLTPASHTHGNITNDGDITTTVDIASGDRLVINDESEGKINNSSITFGTSTTTYLTNKGTWATPIGTTYTFDGTYNASTNKAATVSTVTNAINALDGGTIGTGGAGKTITALSQTNGQVSATFGDISITKSQISDFPTSLTPTAHTHGNISNTGTITSTAVALGNGDNFLFADSSNSGKIERSSITIGTGTSKYLRQDGTWGTPGGTYSLPLAADGTRGGIQIGYNTSGKNYAVQLSGEKAYVNVPWFDTTYSAGTGLSLNGTTFSNSGVTGIKGNSESNYRTGEVNLTPANLGAVRGNSYFFYGTCASEADEVEKAVECSGFIMDDLKPGAIVCVIFSETNNGAVGSLKLNVNGTGAKPIKYIYNGAYSNIPSKDYIKLNQIYHFTYDGTNWIIQLNYNTNTNTLGYQLRTNSMSLPMTDKVYRYRLFFTSADNTHFVPANISTSTNATALRDVISRKINPFGRICYYSSTSAVNAQARPGATTLYDQVAFALGYSFNLAGGDLTLTSWEPVYIKCEPQSDGSAIIYSLEPYVQSLPETDDGFIYIFLGVAYSATAVELMMYHPVYWYKNGRVEPYVQNAQTINGHSVNIDVPNNAVFTDTWNALSISQAGYVSQAPNSTSQFLRGDATWAAVTAANVGLGNVENIKLSTWTGSSNLTTTSVGTLAAAATKGVVTTLDTSANLPTAGAVSTAISNSITTALNNYVTLATEQTISGRKTFQNLATTTFKDSTGSEYCNINYNQTLGALVFSFG